LGSFSESIRNLFFEIYDNGVLEVNQIKEKVLDAGALKWGFQKTFKRKKFTSMR